MTGAGGFVGLRLCARLAAAGYMVKAAVRRDSASAGSGIAPAAHIVRIGDIGPDTDWQAALAGVDMVVHLAARAHVMRDRASDPLAEYRRVNVAGSERLARAAAAAGVSRLIYMSSIKVNGEATIDSPFRESDAPAPLDAYGRSKWEAEQALGRIAAETGLAADRVATAADLWAGGQGQSRAACSAGSSAACPCRSPRSRIAAASSTSKTWSMRCWP